MKKEYNYHFISNNTDKSSWLLIGSDDEWDFYEPDAFHFLVQKIKDEVNGSILEIGDYQYKIDGDDLGLIYQWDSLFGICVICPSRFMRREAMAFLERFF